MTSNLYLILHKVRGEPALDVATCIGTDSDGDIWIIPTSGHRAYPVSSMDVQDLNKLPEWEGVIEMWLSSATTAPEWDTLPDHYPLPSAKDKATRAVPNLLEKLGLKRPKPNIKVRAI